MKAGPRSDLNRPGARLYTRKGRNEVEALRSATMSCAGGLVGRIIEEGQFLEEFQFRRY